MDVKGVVQQTVQAPPVAASGSRPMGGGGQPYFSESVCATSSLIHTALVSSMQASKVTSSQRSPGLKVTCPQRSPAAMQCNAINTLQGWQSVPAKSNLKL